MVSLLFHPLRVIRAMVGLLILKFSKVQYCSVRVQFYFEIKRVFSRGLGREVQFLSKSSFFKCNGNIKRIKKKTLYIHNSYV